MTTSRRRHRRVPDHYCTLTERSMRSTRQTGVATLAMSLILLLIATVITIGTSSAVTNEQRLSGTDSRSKEVHAAASGALQTSLQWLEENLEDVVWRDCESDDNCAVDELRVADTLPAIGDSSLATDAYGRIVAMHLLTDANPAEAHMPVVVRVSATATALGDSHISKTFTTEAMIGKTSIFGAASSDGTLTAFKAPPVLVESCMSNVNGNPEIHPEPSTGIAIGTTLGNTGCINPGKFDLNGGSIQALGTPMTLSETVFGLAPDYDNAGNVVGASRAEAMLRQLEQREPERVYVIDLDNSNNPAGQPSYSLNGGKNGNWHTDLDDEDLRPYILFFTKEAGCPKINGGTVVWGLVFYEDANCSSPGWGSGTVYGSVAVSGSLSSFNANAEVHGLALDFGGSGDVDDGTKINTSFTNRHFSEIPGAWRDF